MPSEREEWGAIDGTPVHHYTLRNAHGLEARLSDYGAALLELHVPDAEGRTADVVLGFDRLADYRQSHTYFGATVGRFGNRIRRGRFALDGTDYMLACNEGANHLHGGDKGFDKAVWQVQPEDPDTRVRFHLVSPDGEEGFPGSLSVASNCELSDDNCLFVDLIAATDKPTVVNLVHHSYWNLAGHNSGTVLDHDLRILADFYTPCDEELMTTGEVSRVDGNPFDFRETKAIGPAVAF